MRRLDHSSKMPGPPPVRPRTDGASRATVGFTLIELLVVVAILVLLVSLLVPSLKQARRLAIDLRCVAKMRNYGAAYRMWVLDHEQKLLRFPAYPNWADIYTEMSPYTDERWIDPAEAKSDTTNRQWWHYGYPALGVFNRAWPTVTQKPEKGDELVNIGEIPSASTLGVWWCKLPVRCPGREWYIGCLYVQWGNRDYHPHPLHGEKDHVNVCRLDGSVRTYPFAEVCTPVCFPEYVTPPSSNYNSVPARAYLYTGYTSGTWSGWLSE